MNESISYLLAQTCKAHRTMANELLHQAGLHAGQEMILHRLWQQDGLSPSELSGAICVQPATITKMVQRMVDTGLLEKRRDEADTRSWRIFLTDRGKQIHAEVQQIWNDLEAKTVKGLTEEQKKQLIGLLSHIRSNMN